MQIKIIFDVVPIYFDFHPYDWGIACRYGKKLLL
jgi:hypothetical protein